MNDRQRALVAVKKAIKAGDLPRLDGSILCVDCGSPAKEYEHRNYAEPLTVEPVCSSCNKLRGRAVGWTPEPRDGSPMEDARKRQGLTVDSVARLAGITYFQALRTLNGQSAKLSVVKKLCHALKIDPALIFEGK